MNSKTKLMVSLILAGFIYATFGQTVLWSQDKPVEKSGADAVSDDGKVDFSGIESFEKLRTAYEKQLEQLKAKIRKAPAKERFKIMNELPWIGPFRKKLTGMIDKDPNSSASLEMLSWWSDNSFQLGHSGLLERLIEHHVESDILRGYVPRIPRLMEREKAIASLRTLAKKSPDHKTQGTATFSLYQMLLETRKPDEKLQKELSQLHSTLLSDYPDVKDRRGNTVAARVAKLDFAKKLAIGQPAPDISGSDLDGVEFKLSDYRGKVVLLSFWGDW